MDHSDSPTLLHFTVTEGSLDNLDSFILDIGKQISTLDEVCNIGGVHRTNIKLIFGQLAGHIESNPDTECDWQASLKGTVHVETAAQEEKRAHHYLTALGYFGDAEFHQRPVPKDI